MRLFAAVWPPEEVLDHLDLALAAVRGATAGEDRGPVRWSAREVWHLTLAFYGVLPEGATPALLAELGAVAAGTRAYELRLRGAGVFAHRTLWAGVAGDLEAHRALTRACADAGAAVGASPDDRVRERPHLTVGRVRSGGAGGRRGRRPVHPHGARGPEPDEALVAALAVYDGPTWQVSSLRLVESVPGAGRGGGPLYTSLEELAFGV